MAGKDDEHKPQQPSGRVRHDKGGRAIWEWAIDSGRDALDSTSRLLKKLDISSLRLMGDDEQGWDKKARKDDPGQGVIPSSQQSKSPLPQAPPPTDPAAQRGQSFNPYDSRTPARPATRASAARKPPAVPTSRPKTSAPAAKRGLLSRLLGRGR